MGYDLSILIPARNEEFLNRTVQDILENIEGNTEVIVVLDGYETEVGDLTKMEDAIMSASRYLHDKANFTSLLDWDKIPAMPEIESAWYDYEFEHKNASFAYDKNNQNNIATACFACGKNELEYLNEYTKKIEDKTIIQSFDSRTLQYLHTVNTSIKTAYLFEGISLKSLDEKDTFTSLDVPKHLFETVGTASIVYSTTGYI